MSVNVLRSFPAYSSAVALILPGCINTQQLVTEKASGPSRRYRPLPSSNPMSCWCASYSRLPPAIDGMIQNYPDSPELLLAGARTYASYAALLEEDDEARAENLYARAKQYAVKSLGLHPLFKRRMGKSIDLFQKSVAQDWKA